MNTIRLILIALFTTLFVNGQEIVYNQLTFQPKPFYINEFIAGDNSAAFLHSYLPSSEKDADKAPHFVIHYDFKLKTYVQFPFSVPAENIKEVTSGKYDESSITILYKGKLPTEKGFGLIASTNHIINKKFEENASLTLAKVAKEAELATIESVFSPNKKFLAVRNNLQIIIYDQGLKENTQTTLKGKLVQMQMTNNGILSGLMLVGNEIKLVLIKADGTIVEQAIEMNKLCGIYSRYNELNNTLTVGKIIGTTMMTPIQILENLELKSDATSLIVETYNDVLKKTKEHTIAFAPEVLKNIGIRSAYINFLRFDDIYFINDKIYMVLHKQYIGVVKTNVKGDNSNYTAEDVYIVSMNIDLSDVKQNSIERHTFTDPGLKLFYLKPLIVVNNGVNLFFYNTKPGAGAYLYELHYGRLDENLVVQNLKKMVIEGPKMSVDLNNFLPLSATENFVFGQFNTGKTGSAFIRY